MTGPTLVTALPTVPAWVKMADPTPAVLAAATVGTASAAVPTQASYTHKCTKTSNVGAGVG